MPVLFWHHRRYAKWLIAAFMVIWIIGLWHESLGGNEFWASQLYLLILPFQAYALWGHTRDVLAGGVLTVFHGRNAQQAPLAPATLTSSGRRFRLTWTERKQKRAVTAWGNGTFGKALEAAIASAREAGPGTLPITATEAGRAVTFGFLQEANTIAWISGSVAAMLLCSGLALWLNQPFFLLPMAGAGWVADLITGRRILMLSGEQLWMLERGTEPHCIPLSTITEIASDLHTTDLLTTDPAYPEIRLNLYTSGNLLRELKRRLPGSTGLLRWGSHRPE